MRQFVKTIRGLLCVGLFVFVLGVQAAAAEELRGTWISYLDWEKLPSEQKAFETEVDRMMENCQSFGLNAVFVHAHSHSDSYYINSDYFPMSKFVTGKQGKTPGYDPFAYMVKAAHAHGLEIHAWFNPYRVTGYMMSWEDVSEDSIAKKWWNSKDRHRNVLKHDGQYYLNPSSPEVLSYVVGAVEELVANYDVDGIHFDDYFYPELNDNVAARSFDKQEYIASGSRKSLTQWRRDNVSRLVYQVNQAVKRTKKDVVFGISPQGYVTHLRSDSKLFVDIDEWMSTDAYVDYIMPQIYWGFEARTADGRTAPYAFENNLNTWISLKRKGPVKLYVGLALYKSNSAQADGNTVSEWLKHDDIIAREVQHARESGVVSGFGFYAYQSFLDDNCAAETAHLLKQLR